MPVDTANGGPAPAPAPEAAVKTKSRVTAASDSLPASASAPLPHSLPTDAGTRDRFRSSAHVDEFRRRLLAFYDQHGRDLPWRADRDGYRVWISEIMLQQTRVDAVIPYYERWMQRFPTLDALADAPPDDVLKAWEGLGYY